MASCFRHATATFDIFNKPYCPVLEQLNIICAFLIWIIPERLVYARSLPFSEVLCRVNFIHPSTFDASFIFSEICLSNLRLDWICIPRYLASWTYLNELQPSVYVGSACVLLLKAIISHLFVLKGFFHLVNQSCNAFLFI